MLDREGYPLGFLWHFSFILTECAVIGRSHGELCRSTAHDTVGLAATNLVNIYTLA